MSDKPISKLRARILFKQLNKQIKFLVNQKTENWDKFGNITDANLDKEIDEKLSVKRIQRAEYRYLSL